MGGLKDFVKDYGWQSPSRTTQRTLFPEKRLEFLAKVKVGEADLALWEQRGWLASTYADTDELDDPEQCEIVFIRNLARSGLFVDDIDRLLSELEKPYSYCPTRVAYSFALGWVETPMPDEVDAAFQTKMIAWFKEKALLDPEGDDLEEIWQALLWARAHASTNAKQRAQERAADESAEEE